ncbi:MAG: hypothetical protein COW28_06010 [bacterium (Candidatus Ratteibacteria) CG15_BIG_FIL_POST_REV_8_21_14_020_41_12]|uniref:PpiC domain-containing protein n=1 Tax=bacterium (Candidatus Ratteibacteria) CG15_BIG_FIL_POST_REV_8_21_14_020_41_12 TaxID=2014291 RepID=A0A2M7GXH6_9BACT|nr:MAG: hypothetical protein COW28_06010 [bacterium (Candidatus Ratteibacteria) CG15_BIG_FIL_POST_REV_8_21_14_020_41_12]
MFKFLRKKKNLKRVYWILAALVIPSFIWWGVGSGVGGSGKGLAAKVNRVPITLREYYTALEKLEGNYRTIFGDKFTEEEAKKLNLKKRALEMLIRDKILFQEIKRRKIRVSNDEILSQIKKDPSFFDKDGKFDDDKFKRIVERIPANELKQIEKETKKSLLLQKLQEETLSSFNIIVSNEEIVNYRKANKERKKMDEEIIRQSLLFQKSQLALDDWYKNLKAEAQIRIWLPKEE